MSFLNISTDIFGLDIGDLSFKIVFFIKRGKKIELKAYGEKMIPPGYFLKGEVQKEKEAVKIIEDFVKEQKISTPYVIAVLPETKTFIKVLELSGFKQENILEIIKKEIELCVPFKTEEVYFDWQIFARSENKTKILVGISPKNIVDSYLRILKMAGLRVVALEIESIAILRALINQKEAPLKPLAIVDLGATRSSLIIVEEEVIQLTISLPHAGANLTQTIAGDLKISFEEAQKIKREFCQNQKNDAVAKNITLFFNNLTQSLSSHLKFYEENSEKKIEKIIVCGGGANLPGLIACFEQNLKIKTIKGNPWINIFEKKPPISEDQSLIYTTAIGLALKGLKERF